MNAGSARGGEILRGMFVEAAAVRIGRTVAAVAAPDSAVPAAPSAEQEAIRAGHEEGRRQGREEGLRAGYEEGMRQGSAKAAAQNEAAVKEAVARAVAPVQEQERRLAQLVQSLASVMGDLVSSAEDEMVALCYETICRVIGHKALQPPAVRDQVAHLLSSFSAAESVVLHLHPQDAALLETLDGTSEGELRGRSIRWVADPEIRIGGAIVQGSTGALDARLETMLASVKTTLLHAREARSAATRVAA
jgi:flagellar assembly protein FliH